VAANEFHRLAHVNDADPAAAVLVGQFVGAEAEGFCHGKNVG
jgi:hypothetical protein